MNNKLNKNDTNINIVGTTNEIENNINSNDNKKKFVSITYLEGITENIIKTINKELNNDKFIFGQKPRNKIKNVFHTKLVDKIENCDNTGVIYKIECNDCEKIYIGETRQKLKNRINQHAYDISKKNGNTAIAEHANDKKHSINLENVTIIDFEHNNNKRKILESIHIIKNNNTVNYKEDSMNVNKYYKSIINMIK